MSGERRTRMAYDEIRLLILLLQRRLESPNLDVLVVASGPGVALVFKVFGVELGVPALDHNPRVAFRAQDVDDGVRQCLLDKLVKTGRSDGHKGVHAGL